MRQWPRGPIRPLPARCSTLPSLARQLVASQSSTTVGGPIGRGAATGSGPRAGGGGTAGVGTRAGATTIGGRAVRGAGDDAAAPPRQARAARRRGSASRARAVAGGAEAASAACKASSAARQAGDCVGSAWPHDGSAISATTRASVGRTAFSGQPGELVEPGRVASELAGRGAQLFPGRRIDGNAFGHPLLARDAFGFAGDEHTVDA